SWANWSVLLASVLTILMPGATRSGLAKPDSVVPKAEKGARVSSVVLAVPMSLVAPTVIANGSLAGGKMGTLPVPLPLLPAATTTTTLLNHRISTAASRGLVLYDSAAVEVRERLTTLIL